MRYFLLLLFLCLLPEAVFSQEEVLQREPALPRCSDPELLEAVNAKVAEYYASQPAENTINLRRQALILKNMKRFQEVDITSFQPSENYQVANMIMMKKMNFGLLESNMRLCRNEADSILSEVYLLIYPEKNDVRAALINFVNYDNVHDEFSVVLPRKTLAE